MRLKLEVPFDAPQLMGQANITVLQSAAGLIPGEIGIDGRISLPGMINGIEISAYRTLAGLYTSICSARNILMAYLPALRQQNNRAGTEELTSLEESGLMQNLYYKREDMTITKAYKVRGALVGMAQRMTYGRFDRFLAVSTGNHALGVMKAAELLRPKSVRIVVPNNTPALKVEKIQTQIQVLKHCNVHATMVYAGDSFDEAKAWTMEQNDGEFYLDPYNDPWVVAGQGTIGLELHQQLKGLLKTQPRVKEVVLSAPIGGGGLLAGTAVGLKLAAAWDPVFKGVSLQCLGVKLDSLDSLLGDAIKVNEPASANRMLFQSLGIGIFSIDDALMAQGMQFVRHDLGVGVEGASGGTLHPFLNYECFKPSPSRLAVSLLSGGNVCSDVKSSSSPLQEDTALPEAALVPS